MKKLLLIVLFLCSGCYAQSMQLDEESPWGPQQAGLQIAFASESALHSQSQNVLERHFGPNPNQSPWILTLALHPQHVKHQFPQIMGWTHPQPRIRMEIVAEGKLKGPQGHKSYQWKVQGDTVAGQEAILEGLLLERLASQMYEELGPRYVYR